MHASSSNPWLSKPVLNSSLSRRDILRLSAAAAAAVLKIGAQNTLQELLGLVPGMDGSDENNPTYSNSEDWEPKGWGAELVLQGIEGENIWYLIKLPQMPEVQEASALGGTSSTNDKVEKIDGNPFDFRQNPKQAFLLVFGAPIAPEGRVPLGGMIFAVDTDSNLPINVQAMDNDKQLPNLGANKDRLLARFLVNGQEWQVINESGPRVINSDYPPDDWHRYIPGVPLTAVRGSFEGYEVSKILCLEPSLFAGGIVGTMEGSALAFPIPSRISSNERPLRSEEEKGVNALNTGRYTGEYRLFVAYPKRIPFTGHKAGESSSPRHLHESILRGLADEAYEGNGQGNNEKLEYIKKPVLIFMDAHGDPLAIVVNTNDGPRFVVQAELPDHIFNGMRLQLPLNADSAHNKDLPSTETEGHVTLNPSQELNMRKLGTTLSFKAYGVTLTLELDPENLAKFNDFIGRNRLTGAYEVDTGNNEFAIRSRLVDGQIHYYLYCYKRNSKNDIIREELIPIDPTTITLSESRWLEPAVG